SNPYGFTSFAGRIFFGAEDGVHGYELWATDGTAAGTRLVKNIYPGLASSSSYGFTGFAGKLFFATNEGLWKTDGTKPGTMLVKDINPYPPGEGRGPTELT